VSCLTYSCRAAPWIRTAVAVFGALGIAHVSASPASDAETGGYAVVHRFAKGEGWNPIGGLVADRRGNLYGVNADSSQGKWYGVTNRGCGLVFKLAPDGTESTVFDFTDEAREGCRARGPLLLESGALYGLTLAGGQHGHGTVYRLTLGGKYQVLHAFNGSDGDQPVGGLALGPDGALYGTTWGGGINNLGTVFKIGADGTFTSLYSFRDGGQMGQQPVNGLTAAADGMLYGTAAYGWRGRGTVFRITTDGQMSLMHSFSGLDGDLPQTLSLGNDGSLLGATYAGGAYGMGTLFRLTLDGRFTSLHSFNGHDGQGPQDPPTQTADGAFYGTTYGGYPGTRSTLYRVEPDRMAAAVLHVFDQSDRDGISPDGRLLVGRDGALYGTTQAGGNGRLSGKGTGTVFRQTP